MTDAQLAQLLHEPPPLGRGINTKTLHQHNRFHLGGV